MILRHDKCLHQVGWERFGSAVDWQNGAHYRHQGWLGVLGRLVYYSELEVSCFRFSSPLKVILRNASKGFIRGNYILKNGDKNYAMRLVKLLFTVVLFMATKLRFAPVL